MNKDTIINYNKSELLDKYKIEQVPNYLRYYNQVLNILNDLPDLPNEDKADLIVSILERLIKDFRYEYRLKIEVSNEFKDGRETSKYKNKDLSLIAIEQHLRWFICYRPR